ncbi:hypothetical protein Rleg10DRAFT_2844 [Rhizobium leguminosarum bv. trifolii WSM2012]|nr:hypothetical protein Rleg10DRAFT_2844 [Rhizobium leguminosarum bv. trifolii WSM2012]
MSSNENTNDRLTQLLTKDVSSFLRSVRSEMSNLLSSTDESLRQKLGEVYAAAIVLGEDKDQWQTFCEQEEWQTFRQKPKPTDSHRQNALRYAVRYAVGFDGLSSNNAAYRYNRALEGCWKQKVPPAEVPDIIKKTGGVEKMKQRNVQLAKAISVQLTTNYFAEKIRDISSGFDALLLIRFLPAEGSEREAEILAGVAAKDRFPDLKKFSEQFCEWRLRQADDDGLAD